MTSRDQRNSGLAKIADATSYLQVSRTKLYRLMRSGELPYVMIGHRRRIPWSALRSLASLGTAESEQNLGDLNE